MKTKTISVLLLSLAALSLHASPLAEQADTAYSQGHYQEAVALYEAAGAEEGFVSAPLLYNLGNASVQAHDYGRAVLYYERARRMAPSDKSLNDNLKYVSGKVEDANRAELKGKRLNVSPEDQSFFQGLYNVLAIERSSNMWAVLAAVLFVLALCGAALYMFSKEVAARKAGFFGSILALGACVVVAIIACVSSRHFDDMSEGVVTAYRVSLLPEPASADKPGLPVLTQGTKVRIVGEEADAEGRLTWVRVRLNSDFTGWVQAADVAVIGDWQQWPAQSEAD